MYNKFIIIFLSIFLVQLLYYLLKNDYSVIFLEKHETCGLFYNNNYINNLTYLDLKLRNIKSNPLKLYCDHSLNFTNKEKNSILNLVSKMNQKIKSNFIKKWKFSKVDNFIENGYPHTHKDTIILPEAIIEHLDKSNNYKNMCSLFIHEKTHIYQRVYEKSFRDLYINYWNFIEVKNIKNLETILPLVRSNPDGVEIKWLFHFENNYILPVSIYNNIYSIKNVDYVGIYVIKQGNDFIIPKNYKKKHLKKIKSFRNFFKNIENNIYHPNELSAEVFSFFYLNKLGLNNSLNSPCMDSFSQWYSTIKQF